MIFMDGSCKFRFCYEEFYWSQQRQKVAQVLIIVIPYLSQLDYPMSHGISCITFTTSSSRYILKNK